MNISIGSDHRGLEQRKVLVQVIESLGHTVTDLGSFTEQSCDYPDIAVEVCKTIVDGASQFGILVCGTGIGMSIAANKVHGIRAALANDVESAKLSRQHNNANVLCLAGNHFDADNYRAVVTVWLETEFEGGRHARRIDKVSAIESHDADRTNTL